MKKTLVLLAAALLAAPALANHRDIEVEDNTFNPSLRNGRTYYRLQFGTSSQAHSAVLCQRMRTIGQSCVEVGLPGGVS